MSLNMPIDTGAHNSRKRLHRNLLCGGHLHVIRRSPVDTNRSWVAMFTCVALLVVGCAVPPRFDHQEWREEVRLRDGSAVAVNRSFEPGEIWYTVSEKPAYRREQNLHLPDGPSWSTKLLPPPSLFREPLAIDRDTQSWILVARSALGTGGDGLIFMRSSTSGWRVVPQSEIPSDLNCNLISVSQRRPAENLPFMTLDLKQQLIARWTPMYRPLTPPASAAFCGRDV